MHFFNHGLVLAKAYTYIIINYYDILVNTSPKTFFYYLYGMYVRTFLGFGGRLAQTVYKSEHTVIICLVSDRFVRT